eukprot:TRINITY_DN23409_c0_g1_i3.p1 TRINITY_DN23409_c0_g1~~TRINITY_DN23409_c0_g1_i3.p1  ORF type:complete len:195 (-),score=8.61 TRINITY_DN23409_c0_g1_i3:141-665(-)
MNKTAHMTGFWFGFSWLVIFGTLALSFWFGGRQVKNGETNLMEVLKVFFAIFFGVNGMANAQMQFPNMGKANQAVQWIFSIIDSENNISSLDESGKKLSSVKGDIELKDVDFVYPQRKTVKVFSQVPDIFSYIFWRMVFIKLGIVLRSIEQFIFPVMHTYILIRMCLFKTQMSS